MKTYLTDIIPKIQRHSKKLDNLTLLTNQHWITIDNVKDSKTVYIFRSNNELLISTNGNVEKAKWEYLGNESLLIDKKEGSYLFKHGFFDENILALKVDSKEEYAFLVNESRNNNGIRSSEGVVEFLHAKYLSKKADVLQNVRVKSVKERIIPNRIKEPIKYTVTKEPVVECILPPLESKQVFSPKEETTLSFLILTVLKAGLWVVSIWFALSFLWRFLVDFYGW